MAVFRAKKRKRQMMEINKIRNIDELKAAKRVIAARVGDKERELDRRIRNAQNNLRRISRPFGVLRSAASWIFALGPLKNRRSLGYKVGYAIASRLFQRKRI